MKRPAANGDARAADPSQEDGEIVGIDLGTTNSAIGWIGPERQPELLTVDGARTCPSVVSFPSGEAPLVGAPALHRLAFDPERTVRSAKRRMGSQEPYPVDGRNPSAAEVQAEVLRHLVDGAEDALGVRPRRAVITVPARFGQAERQDTRRAAKLAGLSVERLLNEPTAAALAYHPEGGERQLLVYDLGGGTFDASVVRQANDLLEVLASHGDAHLGGDDLDRVLSDLVLERWAAERGAAGPRLARRVRESVGASTRLALAVEAAKRELSTALETVVRLDYLLKGEAEAPHLEVALRRHDLEEAIAPFLERTLRSVQQVLSDARLSARDLDGVLLVGGVTRTPAVWDLLHRELGLEPDRSLNPDESVALGAAVQAGLASGAEVGRILIDVAPYSLSVAGLELSSFPPHMSCAVITPRNTPIPSRYAKEFFGTHRAQDTAEVFVFQGASVDPLQNRCLGRVRLTGLKPSPNGASPRVGVEFRYNLDGIVEVTLENRAARRTHSVALEVDGLGAVDLRQSFIDGCTEDGVAPGPGRRIGEGLSSKGRGAGGEAGVDLPEAEIEPEASPFSWVGAGANGDAGASRGRGGGCSQGPDPKILHLGRAGGSDDDDPAPELREDRQTLRRIMGRFPELEQRHAARAGELRELVETARAAFAARPLDPARATAAYESLTDTLFDLGEFF